MQYFDGYNRDRPYSSLGTPDEVYTVMLPTVKRAAQDSARISFKIAESLKNRSNKLSRFNYNTQVTGRQRDALGGNMTDRLYRLIYGAMMLIALYFNIKNMVYFLIGIMILEGITNWRIPLIIGKLRGIPPEVDINSNSSCKISLEAERVWRFMIGTSFLLTYVFFQEQLWFVPWFLAFVIFGAGASDVCPGLLAIKKAGCK